MKSRYVLVPVFLLLSLIANAIFIPKYLALHGASNKVNAAIWNAVHEANQSMELYDNTHSSSALGGAATFLLRASGELQQYSSSTGDGTTAQFANMLSSLGEDIVLKKNIQRDSQIVSRIAKKLPSSSNQAQFDKGVESILKEYPPAKYGLY
ncbi:hypothetical protein JZ785_11175 [Alicyclobacillus curvatus]|nr:hypothetical protein JZ785_11175 [Alicyclobacillus curvatus]